MNHWKVSKRPVWSILAVVAVCSLAGSFVWLHHVTYRLYVKDVAKEAYWEGNEDGYNEAFGECRKSGKT